MKERGLFVRVGVATVEFFRGAPEMLRFLGEIGPASARQTL
jgi:hypothetical protein